jgi:hypothetical protein
MAGHAGENALGWMKHCWTLQLQQQAHLLKSIPAEAVPVLRPTTATVTRATNNSLFMAGSFRL